MKLPERKRVLELTARQRDGACHPGASANVHDDTTPEAHWKTSHGESQTASAVIEGYNAARKLAHEWAGQLAAGHEPEPT